MQLQVSRRLKGRMVLAERAGTVHMGYNYDVFRSEDDGVTWQKAASLPRSPWRRAAEFSRLACRLLRQEVRALGHLSNGRYVAANREGVFYGPENGLALQPSRIEAGDLRLMPPMRITVGPGDCVIWGEYVSPRSHRPVRLFASHDDGRSFHVIRSLEAGSVAHVHNVIYDPSWNLYWVLAGDHDHEPGIGMLSTDLKQFDWLVKGEQRYRAVVVFDLGQHLLYATDTEKELNGLIVLDKATGRTERLREFEGSCIYACRFGDIYALTTTVEPSKVNLSPWSRLWLSRDGEHWHESWSDRKDRWNPHYFQYGSLILPNGSTERQTMFFSGQAVEKLDGQTVVARINAPV